MNLPCYSIGALIHNNDVVGQFEKKGLKVISRPDCEPGFALIRAHGISEKAKNEFKDKGFILIDSTCKNIIKTKQGMKDAFSRGRVVVLIGASEHAEVKGLIDTVPSILVSNEVQAESLCRELSSGTPVSIFTQTTFAGSVYQKIMTVFNNFFSDIEIGSKLCLACSARKNIALKLCTECDIVIIVGSPDSHNTMDLAETIENAGSRVICVENSCSFTEELDSFVSSFKVAGVCSGTSTPKYIVESVVEHLESL